MIEEQDKMIYRHQKDCYVFPIQLGVVLVVPGETFHLLQQRTIKQERLYDPVFWHNQLGQYDIVIEAERSFWNRPSVPAHS